MKLIVGLGNPGEAYADSRHNIGFKVVRALVACAKAVLKRDRGTFSLSCREKIGAEEVILALPLTFMNLSGVAVKDLARKYKIKIDDLLVVCDCMDLEFGRLKLRPGGSAAGQRGLQSIIESLGTQDFARLRVGIGRPSGSRDAADYVLTAFNRKERSGLREVLEEAASCCESWVTKGITETMNKYNVVPRQNA